MTKLSFNYLILWAALGVNLSSSAAEKTTDAKPVSTGKYVPRFRRQNVTPVSVPAEFLCAADHTPQLPATDPRTIITVAKLSADQAVSATPAATRPLAASNADSIASELDLGATFYAAELGRTPFSPEASRDSVKFTPRAGDQAKLFAPLRSPVLAGAAMATEPLGVLTVTPFSKPLATTPTAAPKSKRATAALAQLYADRNLTRVCRALDRARTPAHADLRDQAAVADERFAINIELRALGQSLRAAYETPAAERQRRAKNARLMAARDRAMDNLQRQLCAKAPKTLAAELAAVKARYDLN